MINSLLHFCVPHQRAAQSEVVRERPAAEYDDVTAEVLQPSVSDRVPANAIWRVPRRRTASDI